VLLAIKGRRRKGIFSDKKPGTPSVTQTEKGKALKSSRLHSLNALRREKTTGGKGGTPRSRPAFQKAKNLTAMKSAKAVQRKEYIAGEIRQLPSGRACSND